MLIDQALAGIAEARARGIVCTVDDLIDSRIVFAECTLANHRMQIDGA